VDTKRTGIKPKIVLRSEERFLDPFFASPGVGIAVFDERLRYKTLNSALAAINGLQVEAHLGKMPHELFGHFGAEFEPYLKQGFSDGDPVIFEATGYLPTHDKKGHWINTFIPIKNESNGSASLFVMVLEVSEKKKLEDALFGLTGRLFYLKENLRTSVREMLSRRGGYQTESDAHLVRSLELVEKSATDIADILKTMRSIASFGEYRDNLRFLTSYSKSLPPALPNAVTKSNPLSPREHEVLRLLASNESNKQIAARLQISVRTVEVHRRRVMEKLGLHSLSELVHYAIRHRMVEP
jgi:DNA-binding CsgD family transcriptional regulator